MQTSMVARNINLKDQGTRGSLNCAAEFVLDVHDSDKGRNSKFYETFLKHTSIQQIYEHEIL